MHWVLSSKRRSKTSKVAYGRLSVGTIIKMIKLAITKYQEVFSEIQVTYLIAWGLITPVAIMKRSNIRLLFCRAKTIFVDKYLPY